MCPRCWRENGLTPAMLCLKLLVLLAVGVLIALTLRVFISDSDDGALPAKVQPAGTPHAGTPTDRQPDPQFRELP